MTDLRQFGTGGNDIHPGSLRVQADGILNNPKMSHYHDLVGSVKDSMDLVAQVADMGIRNGISGAKSLQPLIGGRVTADMKTDYLQQNTVDIER